MIRQYFKDRVWIVFWSLCVFGVTLIPYLLGYAVQGNGWRFSGFVFGVEDGNSYIAKMLMGANGEWLFRTPYTSIPQTGVLSFLPYLLLGKLSSEPGQHEQLLALFQGFRLIGILLYCLSSHDFLKIFSKNQKIVRWGVVISTIGGGLGWLSLFGLKGTGYNGLPIDLYSPETFGFLSLFGLPHLAVSRALLVWGWVIFIRKLGSSTPWKNGVLIGIIWLIMGFFQPLSVLTAWAGLGGAWFVQYFVKIIQNQNLIQPWISKEIRDGFIQALFACAISGFWVIYNVLLLTSNSFLKSWAEQNIIRSPSIIDYMIGFSLLIIPIGFGMISIYKRKFTEGYLAMGFVLLFPLLAYFPINLQRRLPDGIWLVLTGIALIGLGEMEKRWRIGFQVFGALGILTSVFLVFGGIFSAKTASEPVFTTMEKIQAFASIEKDWDQPGKPVVLANYGISNDLPAWLYGSVLIGHGPESVNLKEMQMRVDDILYATDIGSIQLEFLQSSGVDYLILENEMVSKSWETYGGVIFQQKDIWVIKVDKLDTEQ